MKAPTNPSKPSALSEPKNPMMFDTTVMSPKNGIPAPPNSTSNTTPSAITEIPISVSLLAQEPIFDKISI